MHRQTMGPPDNLNFHFALAIIGIITPLGGPLGIWSDWRHGRFAAKQAHLPLRMAGAGGGGLNLPTGDGQAWSIYFPRGTGQESAHAPCGRRQLPSATCSHIRPGTIRDHHRPGTAPQDLINGPDTVRLTGRINKNATFNQTVPRQNGGQELHGR